MWIRIGSGLDIQVWTRLMKSIMISCNHPALEIGHEHNVRNTDESLPYSEGQSALSFYRYHIF